MHCWLSSNSHSCTTSESNSISPIDMESGNLNRNPKISTFFFSLTSLGEDLLQWLHIYCHINIAWLFSDFLLYVASVIVIIFVFIFHFAPLYGNSNVLVFTGICSLTGSLSVIYISHCSNDKT